MASGGQQTINLGSLSPQELQNFHKAVSSELEQLQNSLLQLRNAQAGFNESKEAVKSLADGSKGKPALVPLTSSMYVRAELEDPSQVIVELGTGYFAEKSTTAATEYLQRRVDFLSDAQSNLQNVIKQKVQHRDMCEQVLQMKMQEQQQ